MDKKNLIIAGLVGMLVYDYVVHKENRRRFEKNKKIATRWKQNAMYLAEKLDRHEIPWEQFDTIALNEIHAS